jgi:hypothetical protein
MASVLSVLKALKKFKELKKINSGTWDDQSIEILTYDVDVYGDRLTVDCKFKLGDQEHAVAAIHPWEEDDASNEIKIDGADVDDDDVDLDLDTYPFKNKIVLEYRLEYSQNGEKHILVLRASSKLRSLF